MRWNIFRRVRRIEPLLERATKPALWFDDAVPASLADALIASLPSP